MHDHRSRSPVKKSRALSTPAEVDENDNDEEEFADALEHDVPTPSPQPSPPHETKTRQLSQDADDNGLRNGQSERQENADAAPSLVAPDNAATPDAQLQIGTSSLTSAATIPKIQNQTDNVEISAAGDVAAKSLIEETTSVEHVAAALSPAAAVPTATEEAQVRPTTSAMPVPQSEAQITQKIDNQTSSVPVAEGRADSNPREVKRPTPPLSEGDCTTKRPREDEDGNLDPNPRETKRASPPPEKEKEKKERPSRKKSVADAHAQSTPVSPRATPASAFVGFLCPCLFQAMCMLIRS